MKSYQRIFLFMLIAFVSSLIFQLIKKKIESKKQNVPSLKKQSFKKTENTLKKIEQPILQKNVITNPKIKRENIKVNHEKEKDIKIEQNKNNFENDFIGLMFGPLFQNVFSDPINNSQLGDLNQIIIVKDDNKEQSSHSPRIKEVIETNEIIENQSRIEEIIETNQVIENQPRIEVIETNQIIEIKNNDNEIIENQPRIEEIIETNQVIENQTRIEEIIENKNNDENNNTQEIIKDDIPVPVITESMSNLNINEINYEEKPNNIKKRKSKKDISNISQSLIFNSDSDNDDNNDNDESKQNNITKKGKVVKKKQPKETKNKKKQSKKTIEL